MAAAASRGPVWHQLHRLPPASPAEAAPETAARSRHRSTPSPAAQTRPSRPAATGRARPAEERTAGPHTRGGGRAGGCRGRLALTAEPGPAGSGRDRTGQGRGRDGKGRERLGLRPQTPPLPAARSRPFRSRDAGSEPAG